MIVDGKKVALSVVVDGDSLTIDSSSPGVEIASITAVEAVVTPTVPCPATVNRNANLRNGAGTNYSVAGSVRTGQILTVIGRNETGEWLQLADGNWIAAFLVNCAPAVATTVSTPVTSPTQSSAPTLTPTPQPAPPTPAPALLVQNCDRSYPGLCIPLCPPDLDYGEIAYRWFQGVGANPHGFDRDRDGMECKS